MLARALIGILIMGVGFLTASAQSIFTISSDEQLSKVLEEVKAGDTILIEDGRYTRFKFNITESGSPDSPITIRASTPGKVLIVDGAEIIISGDYVVLEGLYFQDALESRGDPVVEIKGSHNRITQCAFWNCHNRAAISSVYQKSHGYMPQYNRIDHCYFADNFGWRIYLDLGQRVPDDDLKYAMYNRIDHCYFSTPFKFNKNTGSTMRIGLGEFGYGRCLIDNNLFERQNGEAELIENKSHENVYLFNTFRNCESDMSFRQGHRTVFINNYLIGTDPNRRAGGLQIWMDNHVVAGNYFSFPHGAYVPLNAKMIQRKERLPPAVVRFKSGYRNFLEQGEPVSHHAANNVTFSNNLFYGTPDTLIDLSANWTDNLKKFTGEQRSLLSGSYHNRITNNVFYFDGASEHEVFYDASGTSFKSSYWANNGLSGYKNSIIEPMLKKSVPVGTIEHGIFRLSSADSIAVDRESLVMPDVNEFADWLSRIPGIADQINLEELANRSIGIYFSGDRELILSGMKVPEQPLDFNNVGPTWLAKNPSQFARDGIMTEMLRNVIRNNLD